MKLSDDKIHIFAFLIATALLYPSISNAEIYRWTDEHGKLHFSDQPPNVESRSFETIEKTETLSEEQRLTNLKGEIGTITLKKEPRYYFQKSH